MSEMWYLINYHPMGPYFGISFERQALPGRRRRAVNDVIGERIIKWQLRTCSIRGRVTFKVPIGDQKHQQQV